MRTARSLVVALLVIGCGPPSWPEAREPEADRPVQLGITPEDPIAGEHVDLVLPMRTDSSCHAWSGTREVQQSEGLTTMTLTRGDPGTCAVVREAPSGSLEPLGPLEEGRYAIVVDGHEVRFEVLPASTHPGDPPRWWRAAWAVVERHQVGSSCARDVGDTAPRGRPYRERSPRLFHQIAALYPQWSAEEIESALCRTQSVLVREISPRELRYRYGAGSLCLEREVIGTIRVRDDGTFEISDPYVLSERHVPC